MRIPAAKSSFAATKVEAQACSAVTEMLEELQRNEAKHGGKIKPLYNKAPFAIKIYACFTHFNVTNSPPHSLFFFFLTKAHVYKGGRELQTTVLLTFFCREINAAATVFFFYRKVSGTQQHTLVTTSHAHVPTVIVGVSREMGSSTREATSRASSLSCSVC